MTLSNLTIASTLRAVQPNVGDQNQNYDIQLDLTKNATISNNFMALAFYKMLNGYVTGANGGSVTTGIIFTAYDQTGNVITTFAPVTIDKIIDEVNTNLVIKSDATIASSLTNVYLCSITASYQANKNNVAEEYLIFTSTSPSTTTWAETITGQPVATTGQKGIMLQAGMSSLLECTLTLFWRN